MPPSFRAATLDDAELLYRWRVEAESAAWYENDTTSFADHLVWLEARIDNPLVHVLIWGEDVGMVRIDSNGEIAFHTPQTCDTYTTVAMLAAATKYADAYGGRLKATVDQQDWRGNCLRKAGFEFYPAASMTFTV